MGQQLLLDFDQELEEGIPVEDSYGQNSSRDLSPSVTAATAAVQDGGSYMAPQHPSDKIVDVGEVIWGARKDMVLYLTRMNAEITFEALVKKPLSQLFKRLDLRKAVDQGTLREKDARFYETLLTFIDSHKPRMSQSDVRRKERWSSYESPVDKWAKTNSATRFWTVARGIICRIRYGWSGRPLTGWITVPATRLIFLSL